MKYLIIVLLFSISVSSAEYYSNSIVVKFNKYEDVKSSKITNLFQKYFADYQIDNLIDEKILKVIDNKYLQRNSFSDSKYIYNPLRRIFVINYSENYDPVLLSKKINKLDFVEYAEPLNKHRLADYPNDLDYDRLYHIPQVKADSAWKYSDTTNKLIIGIVDTGVDYLHDDLKDNIYINQGEFGEDESGNEKAVNGIDDDGNGFIDDWRGWDFASGDSLGQDNNPIPGSNHGTHVAGISAAVINNLKGVAGVANNALILPVKIGPDDPNSRSTVNSYDGLLYAAIAGADVINCSWGSSSFSQAEQDIITEAVSYKTVIVAAAGNDATDGAFYPASYDGVLSVASVDSTDKKSYYSNYDYSVDVTAPGEDIFSTVPNSVYQRMSGTSMSSPVAAGVVCMVRGFYPDASYNEIIERVKATADDIDHLNSIYMSKIGSGRVNALEAITNDNPRHVFVNKISMMENDPDGEFKLNEEISISLDLTNYLNDIDSLKAIVYNQFGNQKIYKTEVEYGEFLNSQQIMIEDIEIQLPDDTPYNYKYNILVEFYDGDEYLNSSGNFLIMNNSYKTFDGNDLTVTATSQGNLCFNDYPNNIQGAGFRYKDSDNLSYEGALMIARDTFIISNVARGSAQIAKNRAFDILENMSKTDENNMQTGYAEMNDEKDDSLEAGVIVKKYIYQPKDEILENVIFVSYDIINANNFYKDSVFAGLYFDWDIGPDVHQNKVYYDSLTNTGICVNTESDSVPLAAIKLISDSPVNFFAVDNDGGTSENPGVYDGFTYAEKWKMLSSGIARKESNITDASMVISAGPLTFMPYDTLRITFALFGGESENHILQTSELIDQYSDEYVDANGDYLSDPEKDVIELIFPNPTSTGELNVLYQIKEQTDISVDIVDVSGKIVQQVMSNKNYYKGKYYLNIKLDNHANGVYFLRFRTVNGTMYEKFILQK